MSKKIKFLARIELDKAALAELWRNKKEEQRKIHHHQLLPVDPLIILISYLFISYQFIYVGFSEYQWYHLEKNLKEVPIYAYM